MGTSYGVIHCRVYLFVMSDNLQKRGARTEPHLDA
jgi:hypothetical protein